MKKSELFRPSKQKTCSLEDTRFFSQLLQSGYSFQMSMEYLETEKNTDVFMVMRQKMQEGEPVENWLPDCLSSKISAHLKSFLRFLSLSEALSLSLNIYDQQSLSHHQLLKTTLSPMILFCVSLFGVQLFCVLCMPSLISMMQGFDVETLQIELMFHLMMILSVFFILLIFFAGCIVFCFTRKNRIVLAVVILYQLKLGKLVEKELSLNFARMYFQCIQLGIPTKKALEMLKECSHQPLIVFLAWHVEQVLLKGGNLEEALSIQYLDSGLQKLMKTAILTGTAADLLKGYLIIAEKRREKRLETISRSIQMISYAFIAVMILLVYQILFLPLSMLERM